MPGHRWGLGTRLLGPLAGACVLLFGTLAFAWTPLSPHDDPLVRMPGTQPADGVVLEAPDRCFNCHDNYDPAIDPGSHWRGSMMAQAARDPLFWSAMAVSAQDSIWALGRPNATDLCLRCHSPGGWLGGRSDPTNGSALRDADFDGVHCDACHRAVDPFFEQTYAGTRDGNDWTGYWDETNASATPSNTAAAATRLEDQNVAATVFLFNGNAGYDTTSWLPALAGWTENGGGQYVVSATKDKRASFADAKPKHGFFYSRYHKSRFFCETCHDVSNPALANLSYDGTTPGDGTTVLPSEQKPAYAYFHVERTFSEFRLSAYGTGQGAYGTGYYDPSTFSTSRPGNRIATCQDCHMPDRVGVGCNKSGTLLRPTESVEHPKSGHPLHDLTGGNVLMPRILASTVAGSPNYDATNATLLSQGPAVLTLDLTQGLGLDANALLDAASRALDNLQRAATVQGLAYNAATGALSFRIVNHTGHKLISGYPEGRRMFVDVRVYQSGLIVHEVNPYDDAAGTLKGLGTASSPALGSNEEYREDLVYEERSASTLTGETHTFHFVLADGRAKDNRIPPAGFRIAQAAARLAEPVWNGVSRPDYFTAAEYAGGYDAISLTVPTGADGVEVSLYYQTTSREYVEFLRSEINGTNGTLASPTPSGETTAYIAQSDSFFSGLKAWGDVIWQLWQHNKSVPGAAPVLMAQAVAGSIGDPCASAGSDGKSCSDGNACTVGDLCSSGACVPGTAVVCAPLNQCHVAGICDTATGQCDNPLKADNANCDDGNACTLGETCQSGSCVATADVTCTALDECHAVGTCDPASGVCDDPALPDGTACTGGSCVGGVCVPTGSGGAGGSAGGAGTAGTGGVAGTAGAAGSTGTGGVAGSSGTGGVAGTAGTAGTGGVAGTAGSAGSGATGGAAGAAGTAGSAGAGATAGSAGAGGSVGGSAGFGGTAASAGSGAFAGSGAQPADAGADAAGGAPPSTSGSEGGCGCATPGGSRRSGAPTLLLLALGAALARRSRRRTLLRRQPRV